MIRTQNGTLASQLGFASQYTEDPTCVPAAFEAGINYFFNYQLPKVLIQAELRPLLARDLASILYTVDSESRDIQTLRQQRDEIRQQLQMDCIDIFFAEYFSASDHADEIKALIEELYHWKAQGWIRWLCSRRVDGVCRT